MAKQQPSVLDAAIASVPIGASPNGLRVDRILSELADWEERDRLIDMLNGPVDRFGHRQLAGIIRVVCDELGVDHEGVTEKNVGVWRDRQAGR